MEKRAMKTILIKTILVFSILFLFIVLPSCVSPIEKQEKANENYVCIPKSALQKGGLLNVSEIENVINPPLNQPVEQKKQDKVVEAVNAPAPTNQSTNVSTNLPSSNLSNIPNPQQEGQQPQQQSQQELAATKKYTEGDLIQLSPKGTDADGDPLTFTYSKPLDKNGKWQTKQGDAGNYIINITASDGKTEVSKQVKIVVEKQNLPPEITVEQTVVVKEGETIELHPKAVDPEGKEAKIYYSGWMDSAEKTTMFTDAGSYIVTITASDGEKSSFKNVTVVVKNNNRAPVLTGLSDITAKETELIVLKPTVTDLDGDTVSVNFSKPFNKQGEWQTKKGDASVLEVKVTATDGTDIVSQRVKITLKQLNNAPIIQKIEDKLVQVGETVALDPIVSDANGDKVTITFSGWMTTSSKKTTAVDGGKHVVTITADDGKEKTTLDVTIEVNSPPEFVI